MTTRAEILTTVRARIDAHLDDLVRVHAESITTDDDCAQILTQATALHDELTHHRAAALARLGQILDVEIPMSKADLYYAKFAADLDQRMGVARDKVMAHLIAVGAPADVVAESIVYFEKVAAAEREEILEETRTILRRVPPDFDLEYPQR